MTQRVLITAGAGGIGLAIAKAFLNEGARVHIADINAEAVKKSGRNIQRSRQALAMSASQRI